MKPYDNERFVFVECTEFINDLKWFDNVRTKQCSMKTQAGSVMDLVVMTLEFLLTMDTFWHNVLQTSSYTMTYSPVAPFTKMV